MYNYNFKENNESIIKEILNVNLKIDGNYYECNFILTEKNLLAFYDINRGLVLWGQGVQNIGDFHILFEISLNKLKYIIRDGNLFILLDGKEINCYDFDLDEFLRLD